MSPEMFHETGFKLVEDLDFEISFYEDLIKSHPDYIDPMVLLGDAYTRKGMHDKALEVDLRLTRLCPDDPAAHYNLACDYSMLKDADKCIETLERAIGLGYRDFRHMLKDPDLEFVRKDQRFKDMVSRFRKR
jgi:tetratricopeptide (TPR) repeat protein